MTNIKRIDIKEFRERGYLQEVNRQFLHPLGLALEVVIDGETGEESLGGVWDYRDDPEGMLFLPEELDPVKVQNVLNEWEEKEQVRLHRFGEMVQSYD